MRALQMERKKKTRNKLKAVGQYMIRRISVLTFFQIYATLSIQLFTVKAETTNQTYEEKILVMKKKIFCNNDTFLPYPYACNGITRDYATIIHMLNNVRALCK